MKENIKSILNEEVEIPEIVNTKCSEAYSMILKESVQSKPKKRFSRRSTVIVGIAAVVAIGFSVPVMAEYIPAFRNAYNTIVNNVFTKDPKQKNNLEEYASNVGLSMSGQYADISIDDVYFDGNDISFSYVLSTTNSELEKSSGIYAKAEVYLGENLLSNITNAGFSKANDGNYYGSLSCNVSEYNITDTSKLKIKFYWFEGSDAYTWVLDDNSYVIENGIKSHDYCPMKTLSFNEAYEFECNVTPDSNLIKTYPVNETKNGITLESIDISPFKTNLNITGIPTDGYSVRVKDNNGNEYEAIVDTGENVVWDASGWETPLKDATSLSVEIFRLDQDDFPTETGFTVPIEKGYREKYDVAYDNTKEITYIPPLEDNQEQQDEARKKQNNFILERANIVEVNQKIQSNSYGIKISIAGSEIVNDFSDYELTDVGVSELENDYLKDLYDNDELALCLVDYEISNSTNVSKSFCFTGFVLYNDDLSDGQVCASDPTYMSEKDHGGKDGYLYDIAGKETRHITIGFLVLKSNAENITYVRPADNSYTILNTDKDFKQSPYGYVLMKIK